MARTISLRMSLLQNTTCTWYCAPEGLLNLSRYTTASDMWSLGCILGEMLQGSVFLKGSSEQQQLQLIAGIVGRPIDSELHAITTDMVCNPLALYHCHWIR
jgi:serine/threonine protein kinase